ncbi:hypothetical protein JCM10207_002937 [Rhodosporidiobolus poonsookiae]
MQWTTSSNQPVHTLPASPHPHHHPHLLSSPSHSPFPFPSSSSTPHAVPFGAVPGSQPGVLGWGVGMSAANGGGFGFSSSSAGFGTRGASAGPARAQTPTSVGWGSAAGPSSPSHAPQQPQQQPNSRRRRRSATPDSSDDDAPREAPAARPIRPVMGSAKRARTAGDAAGLSASGLSLGGAAGGAAVGDLGKALASLDKPSLLNVLSKLLSTSPHLAPTIAALLPSPSLSSILDTLTTLERAVLSALPTGAFLRDDYVWGRARAPLEEYAAETRRLLGLFVPAQASAAPTSEEDLTHPSTAFEFLGALTASLLRLEAALPPAPAPSAAPAAGSTHPSAALTTHLTPALLNAFHLFLTRLSAVVNTEGRIMPSSLLEAWFAKLDELCPVPAAALSPFAAFRPAGAGAQRESAVRRLMDGVRDRARREVGWLVGWKEPPLGSGQAQGAGGMMQDEEEL